jgi:hypothetical protein
MSLVHRFAQEYLARQPHLILPAYTVRLAAEVAGRHFNEQRTFAAKRFEIRSAELEKRTGAQGLRPDLWLSSSKATAMAVDGLAIEVTFRHPVPDDKRRIIQDSFYSWLEFDISDLDAECVSDAVLDKAVSESWRWKWLQVFDAAVAQRNYREDCLWTVSDFKPMTPRRVPHVHRNDRPFRKLEEAERLRQKMTEVMAARRASKPAAGSNTEWFASLKPVERLAVCGAVVQMSLEEVSDHFYQRVGGVGFAGIGGHQWIWQLPVWAKFAAKGRTFTSIEVGAWMREAFPDDESRNERASRNGFTRIAATAHNFLLSLEAQGLLLSDENRDPALRKFEKAPASPLLMRMSLARTRERTAEEREA